MTDFRMDKDKPINNGDGKHCNGNEQITDKFNKSVNTNWVPQEHMTKARKHRPYNRSGG